MPWSSITSACRRGEFLHRLVESQAIIIKITLAKIACHRKIRHGIRHTGVRRDALWVTGEHETLIFIGKIERLDTHVIPRAEQTPAGAVPDDEGEVTQQMRRALRAPFLVGQQHQFLIRDSRSSVGRQRKAGGKLFPVVQPHARRNRQVTVTAVGHGWP